MWIRKPDTILTVIRRAHRFHMKKPRLMPTSDGSSLPSFQFHKVTEIIVKLIQLSSINNLLFIVTDASESGLIHRAFIDSTRLVPCQSHSLYAECQCWRTQAITDHVCNENHVIDWENAKVIDRESDQAGRHIREAIWIRKSDNMNRDEGSYQLSHVRDKLLHTDDRRRKSVLMKASDVKPKRR